MLRVHFYDVGQGLAALVDLPDGRHVLVDAGDEPGRPGCDECEAEHRHLLAKLRTDLGAAPIDMLWITHPHSDHVGGAPGVLEAFPVSAYVDDGRDLDKPVTRRSRSAAKARGASVQSVDPAHPRVPLGSSANLALKSVVPASWPPQCARDPNECSAGLRIDFCASSVLFTGDAERAEEAKLDPGAPVTLLQVAHHGSDTSTSAEFLARAAPRYAVISAGKPGAGLNATYCHPRATTVERLTRALGGPGERRLLAFESNVGCERASRADWLEVPASDHLWATERDGDVTLATAGDAIFVRE